MQQVRIGRDISAVKVPLEEQSVPATQRASWASLLRVVMPRGKNTPQDLTVKISGGYLHLCEMEGYWKPKSPIQRPTYKSTH